MSKDWIRTLTWSRVRPSHCMSTVQFIPRPTEPPSFPIRFTSCVCGTLWSWPTFGPFLLVPDAGFFFGFCIQGAAVYAKGQLCDRSWLGLLCESGNVGKSPVWRLQKKETGKCDKGCSEITSFSAHQRSGLVCISDVFLCSLCINDDHTSG